MIHRPLRNLVAGLQKEIKLKIPNCNVPWAMVIHRLKRRNIGSESTVQSKVLDVFLQEKTVGFSRKMTGMEVWKPKKGWLERCLKQDNLPNVSQVSSEQAVGQDSYFGNSIHKSRTEQPLPAKCFSVLREEQAPIARPVLINLRSGKGQ